MRCLCVEHRPPTAPSRSIILNMAWDFLRHSGPPWSENSSGGQDETNWNYRGAHACVDQHYRGKFGYSQTVVLDCARPEQPAA